MASAAQQCGWRAWLAARPVAVYYALTLLMSWGYWLGLLAQGLQVAPGTGVSHFPGLMAPLLAALLTTALGSGRAGLRAFMGRLLRRPPWPAWGWALSPLLLGAAVFGLLAAAGHGWPALHDFARFPGLPTDWPVAAVFAVVLLVNGLGEEGGWRGFLLGQLQQRHGRFGAAWRVAALWAFWHAPLFWLNQSMQALLGLTLLGWLFGLLCGSFVLADVHRRSAGALLPVAVWHAGYNLMVASAAGAGLAAALISAPVMAWGVAVARAWWREGGTSP